jgi:FAM183A and FAM183B related
VVDRAFRLEAMKRKIQSAGLQPRQKYPFAQTSSQEVGWLVNPLVPQSQKSKELWTFNRKKTPITGYAEEYVTLTKINPFAVKDR